MFVSVMITRMLLSLKKVSAKGFGQGWDVEENNESTLDPPVSPRIICGNADFSNPLFRARVDSIVPMEIIHIRDEESHM